MVAPKLFLLVQFRFLLTQIMFHLPSLGFHLPNLDEYSPCTEYGYHYQQGNSDWLEFLSTKSLEQFRTDIATKHAAWQKYNRKPDHITVD